MARRVAVPSEHDEQVAFMQWAADNVARIPELEMLFAIPNGGLRAKRTAVRMKEEGQKSGIPDVFLDVPCGVCHGLRMELKKRAGGRLSPEQKAWLRKFAERGYATAVAHGGRAAAQTVLGYLGYDPALADDHPLRWML